MRLIALLCLMFIIPMAWGSQDTDQFTVSQADGDTETSITRLPAQGEYLLIWQPSVYADIPRHLPFARQLASSGIEVWLAEFLSSRFLPVTSASMDELPASDMVAVIEAALKTGKQVVLMSADRGSVPVLRALDIIPDDSAHKRFLGAILFTPSLYTHIPQPGQAPDYLPEIHPIKHPLFIFQPVYSPGYFHAKDNLNYLKNHGIDVQMQFLEGMRDGFYMRQEPRPQEVERSKTFHQDIMAAIRQLEQKS